MCIPSGKARIPGRIYPCKNKVPSYLFRLAAPTGWTMIQGGEASICSRTEKGVKAICELGCVLGGIVCWNV